jgi:lysophospholipase L1-like esterase
MNRSTSSFLRLLPILLLACILGLPAAGVPASWESSIAEFEAKDKAQAPAPGGVVFVGSSTIALWKTLTADFPHHHVINRGFGGSELADSVYFADRIVIPYRPCMVILFAGTNEIEGGKTPQQIFAAFQAFVEKVQAALPAVAIGYIEITSSPSRWKSRDAVMATNRLIQNFCATRKNLKFIPVRGRLLGADGLPRKELFAADQLHLNPDGYRILADAVRPFLPPP